MTTDREYGLLEKLVDRLFVDIPTRSTQSTLFPLESSNEQEPLLQKVGLLERALEQVRLRHHALENDFAYEDFVRDKLLVDGDRIHFAWPDDGKGREKGTCDQLRIRAG